MSYEVDLHLTLLAWLECSFLFYQLFAHLTNRGLFDGDFCVFAAEFFVAHRARLPCFYVDVSLSAINTITEFECSQSASTKTRKRITRGTRRHEDRKVEFFSGRIPAMNCKFRTARMPSNHATVQAQTRMTATARKRASLSTA